MSPKLTSKNKVLFSLAFLGLLVLSAFTIFEFEVDGAVLGELQQFVWGQQIVCGNLKTAVPRYWVSVCRAHGMLLARVAGKQTVEVYLVPVSGDPAKWEQNRIRWLDYKTREYQSEGFEPMSPPHIESLGGPATCIAGVNTNSAEVRLECGTFDGRILAVFKGKEKDIPNLISILTSLRQTP